MVVNGVLNSTITLCCRCSKPLPFYSSISQASRAYPPVSQATRKFQTFQSRHLHTSSLLSQRPKPTRQAAFDPITAETNVMGLVHPEMMNRMKYRYPLQWLLAGSIAGLGFVMLYSPNPAVPPLGGCIIAFSGIFLATMWYNARCIGRIALNQDMTATISHLNMMGRRIDKTVPISSLKQLTRQDHKQWIGESLYYINWEYFKTNDKLWNSVVLPKQKDSVFLPDFQKNKKTS